MAPEPCTLTIRVDPAHGVSALYVAPRGAIACYVFAHGAGAGMEHPFMAEVAAGLAARGIASLRYQFPYMEAGSKRPDRPALAQATVAAAVAAAGRLAPRLPLFAGGKSFGGRMTSQAQAAAPLPKVRGLVFLGFPLHPPEKPGRERARHLSDIAIPMLFLQGDRDALAEKRLIRSVVNGLGPSARLTMIVGADHSFRVLVRSGRTDEEARDEMLDAMTTWIGKLVKA